MELEARQVLLDHYQTCVSCLEPKRLLAPLFQRDVLTSEEYEKWVESEDPVDLQCQHFLDAMLDRCPFQDFLYALRAGGNADLAHVLEDSLKDTMWKRESIPSSPKKSPVHSSQRRRLLGLSMNFKQLAHEGAAKRDKFNELFMMVQRKWKQVKADPGCVDPEQRALMASYMFTALDSKAGSLRVMYSMDLCDTDILQQMAELVPKTVDPRLSTVAMLARRGTALSMRLPLGQGLDALGEGEAQTQQLAPCKESALIFYEKTNLLLQRFDVEPTRANREAVIEAARQAETHFWHEENFTPDQKEQCGLMALLKVCFALLGIGIFGQAMEGVRVRECDNREAENILARAQHSLKGMDARRRMMVHIAWAVLHFRRDDPFEALQKAKQAEDIAKTGKFDREQQSIQKLMRDIEDLTVSD